MSRSLFFFVFFLLFFKRLNATIPVTCTLAYEYPSSNENSKKNGTVRGDCIACDALFVCKMIICTEKFEINTFKPIPLPFSANTVSVRCGRSYRTVDRSVSPGLL